jgi:hypothetical protein
MSYSLLKHFIYWKDSCIDRNFWEKENAFWVGVVRDLNPAVILFQCLKKTTMLIFNSYKLLPFKWRPPITTEFRGCATGVTGKIVAASATVALNAIYLAFRIF